MDQNGHGTHVAGIVGAKDNGIGVVGIAANATLVAVRVLNDTGAGYYSSIISGIDYVTANARSGDVMNLSLGGPSSRAIDDAVRRAAGRGIRIAVAAGNESQNTADISPARLNYAGVYTVSAVDKRDAFARFSNYGLAVDAAAPGVSITSTRLGGGVVSMSGTSMATPHVAGLLLLGKIHANGYAALDPDGCPDPLAYR
jgi:subtilisin family serine protease